MKPFLAWRGLHFFATRFGWPALKRAAFDAKYQSGDWAFTLECPELVDLVVHHCQQGRIAVLGCGSNALGRALPEASYSSLTGFDLSPDAIAFAREHSPSDQDFTVADMTTFTPAFASFNLMVFPESLYYVPAAQTLEVLRRVAGGLTASGRIIATFAQPDRYAGHLNIIRANFRIEESRPLVSGKSRHAIIFQPHQPVS